MSLENEEKERYKTLTKEIREELDSYTGNCRGCGNAFTKSNSVAELCIWCQVKEYAERKGIDSEELAEYLDL